MRSAGGATRCPDGFRFAVKASRYLTHVRRLEDPRAPVEFLMERASELGDRLGAVLLQLPPSLEIDLDRLDATLRAFRGAVPVAVEPRHKSWFVPELCQLLREHGAAFVLADRRGPITPLWTTSDWTYVRLHQGRATPRPCYGPRALRSWVDRVPVRDGFVFFNNDHRACAVHNARAFEAMLERRARVAPDD